MGERLPPEHPKSGNSVPPIDYYSPERQVMAGGCLVGAIVLAVAVGGLCALAILIMGGSTQYGLAIALGVGLVVIIVAAILAGRKFGMSAALAIALAAGCALLLMIGLCSRFAFGG